MAFWAAAQLQPQRDGLAVSSLAAAGYQIYAPRIRDRHARHGRLRTPLLFPGYLFVLVELQWRAAQTAPGVVRLVGGLVPMAVPDTVIQALKAREGPDRLIELPRPPKFSDGDRVRVLHGPFADQIGIYAGMRPHERVEVLLALLGGPRRVTLAAEALERVTR